MNCLVDLSIAFRFYKTNIVEASNLTRYASNAWECASPEVRKAYGAGDSFEDYYKRTNKKIPNLRYVDLFWRAFLRWSIDALMTSVFIFQFG